MPWKVRCGTSKPARHKFFINSLFSTTHRIGYSPGNSLARATWVRGLQLETINHGIFLGKPDRTFDRD